MWSNAVAKRVLARSRSCRSSFLGSNFVEHLRFLSDDNANNNNPPSNKANNNSSKQQKQQNRKPPQHRNNKQRPYHKERDPSNRKQNFDDKYLKPRSSGRPVGKGTPRIPKLAARKSKASLEPIHGRNKDIRFEDALDDNWGNGDLGENWPAKLAGDDGDDQKDPGDDYYDVSLLDDDKYFWHEEDVEQIVEPVNEDMLPPEGQDLYMEYLESDRNPTRGEPDESHMMLDDGGPFYDSEEEKEEEESNDTFNKQMRTNDFEEPLSGDPEQNFYQNQFDITTAVGLPEELFSDKPIPDSGIKVLPLDTKGPGLDDFLEAMTHHPAEYARVEVDFPHPDSQREPKPLYCKFRAQPPIEFVESYKRFLYITGFPLLTVNGEIADLENKVHFKMLQNQVTERTGVDSAQVYPVNLTSAFVGYNSPRELALAIQQGPAGKDPVSEPTVRAYSADDAVGNPEFTKDAESRIIKVSNLPPGHSSQSLHQAMFPKGTEVGDAYSSVTPQDIHFVTRTCALVRFSSDKEAAAANSSKRLRKQLTQIGTYRIQYLRARRELVHSGFGGPANQQELRLQGPRLIVDNEMPPKQFYISHAGTIQISNLDPDTTKEQITAFFQLYCEATRDVQGSVEFVTCELGVPMGQAYVGFDHPGEAEAVMKAVNGQIQLGNRRCMMKLVRDRLVPNRSVVKQDKRPLRTEAELLTELNDWERFVDPQDVEDIVASGITKDILDEAMRGLRFHNPTFGPLDDGMRGEALQPERERGSMYKEAVQLYIKTLKECLPTEEQPGELYEVLHGPDEPLDLSVFEDEEERKAMLKQKRSNPII